MINGNNQVGFNLAKNKDGAHNYVPLEDVMYSRVVFPLDESIKLTVTVTTDNLSLNSVAVDEVLYVDGSSKVDGQLDGGIVAQKIVSAGDPIVNVIGNVHANVMPLLDTDHNEILKDNGDGIYVAITTTYNDGTILTGSELKVNFFSYDSAGQVVAETVPVGDYNINLNTVYAWANARIRELDTSKAIGSPLNETSREEVVKLMESLAKVKADIWVKVNVLQDSASVTSDTYTLDLIPGARFAVGFDVGGVASTITNDTTYNTVNGITGVDRLVNYLSTFNTEAPGINVYFNGVKIPTSLITVSSTKISIDNTKNEVGTGKIFNGDVFTIEFQDEL